MCAHTRRLFLTAMLGGVIAPWITNPLPITGQSSPTSDEDRLLLGTWKLNAAQSKYKRGVPPRSQIRIYEPQGQGVKATIKTVYADGRSTTVEYVANYDSLEYPVTGSPDVDTIALKKVLPRIAQAVLSHAGKVMATARRVISEDGKTMTIEYQGELLGEQVDYVAVYNKEQ